MKNAIGGIVATCVIVAGCTTAAPQHKFTAQADAAAKSGDPSKAVQLRKLAAAEAEKTCRKDFHYAVDKQNSCSSAASSIAALGAAQIEAGDGVAGDATVRAAVALEKTEGLTASGSPYAAGNVGNLYSRAIEAHQKVGDVASATASYNEARAAGVPLDRLPSTIQKNIDPAGADRRSVDLALSSPGPSVYLRNTALIAQRRGWRTEATRLLALAVAVDSVDQGDPRKGGESEAALREKARQYAAAGAPEYARYYENKASEEADSRASTIDHGPSTAQIIAGLASAVVAGQAARNARSTSVPSTPASAPPPRATNTQMPSSTSRLPAPDPMISPPPERPGSQATSTFRPMQPDGPRQGHEVCTVRVVSNKTSPVVGNPGATRYDIVLENTCSKTIMVTLLRRQNGTDLLEVPARGTRGTFCTDHLSVNKDCGGYSDISWTRP